MNPERTAKKQLESPFYREKNSAAIPEGKVKFEVYGEEMIEKKVKLSGNSGRVYLPPDWVDHHVKIIRID
jgi:putative transposon-encoded protein